MSEAAKVMVALANLSQVRESAQFLADVKVLRQEDVVKCCRVFIKKHPEIQSAFDRLTAERHVKEHGSEK